MKKFNLTSCPLYLLILALPWYVFRFTIFDLPTTVLELTFFILTASWLVDFVIKKRKIKEIINTVSNPLLLPTLTFLFAGIVSVVVSPNIYKGLGAFRAYILEPIIVYFIILNLVKENYLNNEKVKWALLISGLPLSLYGLYQYLTGTNTIAPLEAAQGRITSLFNHPNFLALYLGPLIILILGSILERKSQLQKRLLIPLFVLYLLAFYLAFSQGGLIALVFSFGFFIGVKKYYQINDKLKSLVKKLLGFSLATVGIGLVVFYLNISSFTPDNKLVWPRPNPGTYIIRLCLWEGTKGLLTQSPVFGAGLSGFIQTYPMYRTCDTEHFTYPHNIVLNFWTEMGLLGLVSFFWLVYTLFKLLLHNSPKGYMSLVLSSIIFYWLIHGLVDVPYLKNDLSMYFWIIAAMVVLTGQKGRQWDRSQS